MMAASSDTLTLHRYQCSNESYTLDLGGGVELTLMLIPAGEFMMGSRDNDFYAKQFEKPQHRVQLLPFLMGMTPVTQAQWNVVTGYEKVDIPLDKNPSNVMGEDLPVERVSWYEAHEFCQRLSQKTGKNFHLPSESQWEYACRAETTTDYHFGPKITVDLANYEGNVGKTSTVKRYPPNRFGLYDMHGNVWEWCQDHWHSNYDEAPFDGSSWLAENDTKTPRLRRGGSWDLNPRSCRSAYRFNDYPDVRSDLIGFRVSC